MNRRRAALFARRNALIARADGHRDEIARAVLEWERPLAIADRVLEFAGILKRNAPLLGVGLAALLAPRLRNVTKWLGYAETIWKWTRRLR